MNKAITVAIIFIVLFTTILPNRACARDTTQFEAMQNGVITQGSQSVKAEASNSLWGNIGSLVSVVAYIFPWSIHTFLSLAILPDVTNKIPIFTIEDLLLGRFELFNVDFMGVSKNTQVGSPAYVASNTNVLIKENVARWFYAMRDFAVAALLAVLIYIGIMMAISSIASEKAKYKNMLIHWFVSFIILMLLPYIIAITTTACEKSVDIIRTIAESLADNKVNNTQIQEQKGLNFEQTLLYGKRNDDGSGFEGILTRIVKGYGWNAFSLVLVFAILAYYQFKFFFLYLKRMLIVGFLIVISPLITITYSIDKAGDNQAQAYQTWLKEFLINIFIQPIHALLFVIFMYSVYSIMERAPLLAIVFLAALSRGEQLVRNIFQINKAHTFGGLRKGK